MDKNTKLPYDITDPISIFEYAMPLIGHTLREVVGAEAIAGFKPDNYSKGLLGQMVEELYYHYKPNNSPEPDFKEAGVELKTTGLKQLKDSSLQIKERLVIDMINYNEVVNQSFEMSIFFKKFRLMLLLFYLYAKDLEQYDRLFIYIALWKIPDKDLLIIKHDYEVIIDKIKRGEAHLLSEGDTEYLGACRKGQKGDSLREQPFSPIGAPRRAFSLKPAYMRTVLDYIKNSNQSSIVNYDYRITDPQLVTAHELQEKSFEQIILESYDSYIGKNYEEMCSSLGMRYDKSKDKYARIASRIVTGNSSKVNQTEEFKKAGLQMKTIRIEQNGRIREAMSFENIDYYEVLETEDWVDSRLYEIFTGRFLFVIFKADGGKIRYYNSNKNKYVEENSYTLDSVFFWTMPSKDIALAEEYWNHIRQTIKDNKIDPRFFNSPENERFHVRPKGRDSSDLADNPNGGKAKKYCYWFNNEYVREIVKNNGTK